MNLNWDGLILGVVTFLIIGVFHPIVIKTEYYIGAKKAGGHFSGGLGALVGSVLVADTVGSALLGVLAFSLFWSIGELFEQEKEWKKAGFLKIRIENKKFKATLLTQTLSDKGQPCIATGGDRLLRWTAYGITGFAGHRRGR